MRADGNVSGEYSWKKYTAAVRLRHDVCMQKVLKTMDIESPVGIIRLSISDKGLCAVKIVNTKSDLKLSYDKGLKSYSDQLEKYVKDVNTKFDLPMDVEGTAFQKAVWKATSKIPYGKTMTYQQIAEKIGKPKAVRAVGTALGKNPVCIVIPCHRVVPKSGGIGNYAYGSTVKKWLLAHESGQKMA